MHGALGDRVRTWTTVNEPWCSAFLGLRLRASTRRAGRSRRPACGPRTTCCSGTAWPPRRSGPATATRRWRVSLNLYAVEPATRPDADVDAARRIDGLQNRLFLDALLRGRYPADVLADVSALTDLGHVRSGDLDLIAQPLDALGRQLLQPAGGPRPAPATRPVGPGRPAAPGCCRRRSRAARTSASSGAAWTPPRWTGRSTPPGSPRCCGRVGTEYPAPPLYVTENGAAFADTVGPDGRVHDPDRTAYLAAHVAACRDAVAAGVDLRGYFVWSFLDNFEWAWGYDMRFGIVHVDFATQRREPKDSARWYAESARRNAPAPLPVDPGADSTVPAGRGHHDGGT